MANLLGFGKLLFQVGDFLVKAIVSYADTDEGAKEWGDVVGAFVELDLFDPGDIAQGVTVERAGEEKPLTQADIERMSESFEKPVEQASQGGDATRVQSVRLHRQRLGGQGE